MAIDVKEGRLICTTCNSGVMRLKDYYEDLHRDDPEYFWEPWDDSENHMYICPTCKNQDFPS
jgi:hypothetical protein